MPDGVDTVVCGPAVLRRTQDGVKHSSVSEQTNRSSPAVPPPSMDDGEFPRHITPSEKCNKISQRENVHPSGLAGLWGEKVPRSIRNIVIIQASILPIRSPIYHSWGLLPFFSTLCLSLFQNSLRMSLAPKSTQWSRRATR